MDPIKEAFSKAKQDIAEVRESISYLHEEIISLKQSIEEIKQSLNNQTICQSDQQTDTEEFSAFQQIKSTENTSELSIPTDKFTHYGLKSQNKPFSTGNKGVPTDRQTNQQTDQHTGNKGVPTQKDHIQKVSELLQSLDEIKQEVRIKFKKLTAQEMIVFATIYQLEEESIQATYSIIANKLSLSESSIRDYTQRIIKKGIPLLKTKENNKKVSLAISPELKKIAALSTIIQLREL
jgi:hypothetical protein